MKNSLTALLALTTGLACAQSFEGTLQYTTDVEVAEGMKKYGMTKETLIEKMKKEGTYADTVTVSYKGGNYYMVSNTTPRSWAIYTAATHKIHELQAGEAADICTVTDASMDSEFAMTGKMPTVTKLDTTVTLDGATCNIVRVKWKGGPYAYWYDPARLTVDPALFSTHVYDGWAEFLKISHALPVRIVKTTKGMMTVTRTLVSVKQEPVADSLFALPKLVPAPDLNVSPLPNREVMRVVK